MSNEPSPTNFCAVTIPVYVACPFDSIVTPVPTATELPAETVSKYPVLHLTEVVPKSKALSVFGSISPFTIKSDLV